MRCLSQGSGTALLLALAGAPLGQGLGSAAQAQDVAGYVLDVRGEWYASGAPSVRLSKGMGLLAADTVRPRSRPAVGRITVMLRTGASESRRCPDVPSAECGEFIVLPPVTSSPSLAAGVARVFDAVAARFRAEPAKYTLLMSRGRERPGEAVIPIRRGAIDLGPVLTGLDRGTYRACLLPVRRGTATSAMASCDSPTRISWRGSPAGGAMVPAVTPGLYRVHLVGQVDPSIWVLVSDDCAFERLDAAFARARAVTLGWGQEVAEQQRRSFLRAYLDHLAGEPMAGCAGGR